MVVVELGGSTIASPLRFPLSCDTVNARSPHTLSMEPTRASFYRGHTTRHRSDSNMHNCDRSPQERDTPCASISDRPQREPSADDKTFARFTNEEALWITSAQRYTVFPF